MPHNIFYAKTSMLDIGVTLYSNSTFTIIVPAGVYSDGNYCYTVNSSGVIVDMVYTINCIAQCTYWQNVTYNVTVSGTFTYTDCNDIQRTVTWNVGSHTISGCIIRDSMSNLGNTIFLVRGSGEICCNCGTPPVTTSPLPTPQPTPSVLIPISVQLGNNTTQTNGVCVQPIVTKYTTTGNLTAGLILYNVDGTPVTNFLYVSDASNTLRIYNLNINTGLISNTLPSLVCA
jgi:hypothetical protein